MAEPTFIRGGHRRGQGDFLQRLVCGLLEVMEHANDAEEVAGRAGLLQALDPRIKILGLLTLIITAVFVKSLLALLGLFVFAVALALASRISLWRLARQVWIGVLLFTGLIALPAIVLVPGDAVAQLPWVGWSITLQGLRGAAFLIGRAETAATLALLAVLTTPWPHLLKALQSLRVPLVLVVILGMTHRYIFVLLTTAANMMEARRSRVIGRLKGAERRRIVVSGVGVLLDTALQLSAEVHLAMVARGYRGELHLLHDFRSGPRDWLVLLILLAVAGMAASVQWWSLGSFSSALAMTGFL